MSREMKQKHTLHLREGDFDYLRTVYENRGVSVSLVIRKLVSNFVDELRTKEGPLTLDLGDLEE